MEERALQHLASVDSTPATEVSFLPPPSTSPALTSYSTGPIYPTVNLVKGAAEGPTTPHPPRKGVILQRQAEPDSNPRVSVVTTLTPSSLPVTQGNYEQSVGWYLSGA